MKKLGVQETEKTPSGKELQYGTAISVLFFEPNGQSRSVRVVAAEMYTLSQQEQKPVFAVLDGVNLVINAAKGDADTVIAEAANTWWQIKLRRSGGRRSGSWV